MHSERSEKSAATPEVPKRSLRRHHLERMKAKAKQLYAGDPRALRYANHLTVCSCPLCGNRRTWLGPTIKERRRLAPSAGSQSNAT